MSKFVEPFLSSQKPSITFNTAALAWGDPSAGGVFALGRTGVDPNSGTGASSVVTFNEKMLENSSPLFAAVTTVHETLHGYINYNEAVANSAVGRNDNWMAALNGFYLTQNLPPNYSNHTMMLTD